MNVLSKIVIPKTNVTSMYILSELEEFAREEFFRLKKILDIKRRMYGSVNEKKKEPPVMCTTCDSYPEWGVIERCIMCDALILPEEEKTEEDEKLEEFKTHLSEILNITQDMDEQGVIAASVEEFIKTAKELKEKLEQKSESVHSEGEKKSYDEMLNHLCEECKKKYLEEKAAEAAAAAAAEEPEPVIEVKPVPEPTPKPVPEPILKQEPKPIPVPAPPAPPVTYDQDLELGTFETEIKEITKVIRVKAEDGSVTEEKKVIKIKKEVRTPIKANALPSPNAINQERPGRITYQPSGTSGTSSKSTPYSGSKTIGVVTTKSLDYFQINPIHRKARSVILNPSYPMSDPVVRYCMSSVTLLSVDFGEYSPNLVHSCSDYDEYELIRRMNVLKKIVIPRTNVTAEYILSELEELAREEFHRLKKVKEKKKKDNKKKHDHAEGHFCPICDKRTDDKTKVLIEKEPEYFLEAKPIIVEQAPKPIEPKPPEPQIKVIESRKTISPPTTVARPASGGDVESRLNFIRRRITDIITISKGFVETGIDAFNVNEFLRICEEAKIKVEHFFETEQVVTETEDDITDKLQCLKCNLRDVVDVTKEFKEEGFDKFIKACEDVDSKLEKTIPKTDVEQQKIQKEELKSHLDDVMQMAQDYETEGLLSPGVEEFLTSCSIIKAKLEGKPVPRSQKDIEEEKLDHLKDHVSELEELTAIIEDKKITSASVEKFVSSCKEFKRKIEEDRAKLQERKALHELSRHIAGTVEAGKEANKEGLLGESIEDFIKSIGDVNKNIKQDGGITDVTGSQEPNTLEALKSHIDNIIKSVAKLRSGNILSISVDEFLHSCEEAKAKIDLCQKYDTTDLEKRIIYPTCGDLCVCEGENGSDKVCEKCQNMDNLLPFVEELSPPCASCDDNGNKKPKPIDSVCEVCSRPIEEDILLPEPTPPVSPAPSNVCEVCEGIRNQPEPEKEEEKPGEVDSSLGYFEKKVRKITKVTRTQNPDGTIREEKETITVRTEKHDPTQTSLDDDENEEYDVSYESLLDDGDEKQVAVCSIPSQNQRGFLFLNKRAKSEMIYRMSPMTAPILKNCISHDMMLNSKDPSSANDSMSVELEVCFYCNSNMIQHSENFSTD